MISLGNTFLPDVYNLFFALISYYFWILFFETGSQRWYVFFILFTVLGTLTRQSSILIPLIFVLNYLFSKKTSGTRIKTAFLPLMINFVFALLFERLMKHYDLLPANYNLQIFEIIRSFSNFSKDFIIRFCYGLLTSSICLGILIFPLLICNLKYHITELLKSKFQMMILLVLILIVLGKVVVFHYTEPFVGNLFHGSGIGPVIMTGYSTDEITSYNPIWGILNFVGIISFYFSFSSIVKKGFAQTDSENRKVSLFVVFLFVLYLLPICLNYANDRYLLFLLPFFYITYVYVTQIKILSIVFVPFFVIWSGYSLLATYDYFSLNKARWSALKHLTLDVKIPPKNIDGGFEFNGYYLSEKPSYDPLHKNRWWWVEDDTYIVSPVKRKGYRIISIYPFKSYFSYSFDRLFVLKKGKKI